MKQLDNYILEKLKLNKDTEIVKYMVVYSWKNDGANYILYDTAEDAADGIRNGDGKQFNKNGTFHLVIKISNERNIDKIINLCYKGLPLDKQTKEFNKLGADYGDEVTDLLKKKHQLDLENEKHK